MSTSNNSNLFPADTVNNGQPLYDNDTIYDQRHRSDTGDTEKYSLKAYNSYQSALEEQQRTNNPQFNAIKVSTRPWSEFPKTGEVSARRVQTLWDQNEYTEEARREVEDLGPHFDTMQTYRKGIRYIYFIGLESLHVAHEVGSTARALYQHRVMQEIFMLYNRHILSHAPNNLPNLAVFLYIDATLYRAKEDGEFIMKNFEKQPLPNVIVHTWGNFMRAEHLRRPQNLFVCFRPANPIRQMLADTFLSVSEDKWPQAVICAPWRMDHTPDNDFYAGDRNSDRVKKWLERYHSYDCIRHRVAELGGAHMHLLKSGTPENTPEASVQAGPSSSKGSANKLKDTGSSSKKPAPTKH